MYPQRTHRLSLKTCAPGCSTMTSISPAHNIQLLSGMLHLSTMDDVDFIIPAEVLLTKLHHNTLQDIPNHLPLTLLVKFDKNSKEISQLHTEQPSSDDDDQHDASAV